MRTRESIARHVGGTGDGDGIHAPCTHRHIGGKRYGITATAHRAGEHRLHRFAQGICCLRNSYADGDAIAANRFTERNREAIAHMQRVFVIREDSSITRVCHCHRRWCCIGIGKLLRHRRGHFGFPFICDDNGDRLSCHATRCHGTDFCLARHCHALSGLPTECDGYAVFHIKFFAGNPDSCTAALGALRRVHPSRHRFRITAAASGYPRAKNREDYQNDEISGFFHR